jgi:predicted RNase H-like nuclease (RuvC/YqgF family)
MKEWFKNVLELGTKELIAAANDEKLGFYKNLTRDQEVIEELFEMTKQLKEELVQNKKDLVLLRSEAISLQDKVKELNDKMDEVRAKMEKLISEAQDKTMKAKEIHGLATIAGRVEFNLAEAEEKCNEAENLLNEVNVISDEIRSMLTETDRMLIERDNTSLQLSEAVIRYNELYEKRPDLLRRFGEQYNSMMKTSTDILKENEVNCPLAGFLLSSYAQLLNRGLKLEQLME